MVSYPTGPTSTSYHGMDSTFMVPTGSGDALQLGDQYYMYSLYDPVLQGPMWPSPPVTSFQQPTLQSTPSPPSPYYDGHPESKPQNRASRSSSFVGTGHFTTKSSSDPQHFDYSRSLSPLRGDLSQYGYRNDDGSWSCSHPGCTSQAVFTRGCDLRKHYKRHTKSLFCQHEGCPRAHGRGFGSKNDLARHEEMHNPRVLCEWEGCQRVFSRVDNMVTLS